MITIEIDGKTCQAASGQMLIDVADAAGIDIPRFCYHKKLLHSTLIIFLSFVFGIFGVKASEETVVNKVYKTTTIEESKQNKVIYEHLPSPSNSSKVLVNEIESNYSIGIGKSLSYFFEEAEWTLTSDGIAVVQLDLLKTSLPEALKLKGTYSNQNGITQLHVIGTERHGLKIAIDGILQPNDKGFYLDGIFTTSVRDARHVERIALNLEQNLISSENEWGGSIIDEIRKTRTLKNDEKPLLSETTKWISGVPVPTIFDVDMKIKLDDVQLNTMKGQLLLDKAAGLAEPTVDIMLTTGGEVVPGWSAWKTGDSTSLKIDTSIMPPEIQKLLAPIQQTSQSTTTLESDKNKGIKVTANNGHILVTITPAPPFREISWYVKNLEHPDENILVLVDEGTIDIGIELDDKKRIKVLGTINAQGKVLAGNRPMSTFSAELSGKQQGRDLVEKIARDVGARPFDGHWNDPNIGELNLRQQHDRVSGNFAGNNIEEGVVTNSIVNLHWKNSMGELRKGFLSSATDGLLVGMSWNENLSFEPVIAVQSLSMDKSNSETSNILVIDNDAQARELKYLGYDLASIGKHKEATKILLQVVEYYHKNECIDLKMNLINQGIPLNTLINSAFEAGEYNTLTKALKMALHVQNELQKSKADLRSFLEQSGKYIADINKSAVRMKNLKAGFDNGITALSRSGIGIDFDEDFKGAGIKISGVRPDMPASQAGIVVGDLIVAIDGVSVSEMNAEKVSIALRGTAGSSVSIKLSKDEQYREVKLVRAPLFNMSFEQREELINNMKTIRNFTEKTGKYYHEEIDKLKPMSIKIPHIKIADMQVAIKTLTTSINEHQKYVENQRDKAIELSERCFSSPLVLNLFQRFIMLESVARNGKIDEKTTAGLLKLDQEEEALKINSDISEMDKSLLTYSIIIVSEFDAMKENMRSELQLIDASSSNPSPNEFETANTLAGLTGWLDIWRSRMITDAAKIASLDLGQDFYTDYVQALVEMNLPEQALQASEVARARAFADLLASSHSKDNLTNVSATKAITLDEIRQLVRDTGNTVVEYFIPKEGDKLLTWVIKPPNSESKDVQIHLTTQQLINGNIEAKIDKLISALKPLPQLSEKTSQEEKEKRIEDEKARAEIAKVELKNLYDILIAPIKNLLPQKPDEIITVVPHGELFQVPFAALTQIKNDKTEHYLIQDHTLTYAPSLSVLNLSRQIKRESVVPSSLLAAIKPDLKNDELGEKFPALPAIEDISKATVSFYEPKSTVILSGENATQEKVLSEAKLRDVILFYTHAKALSDPLKSYVALTDTLLTAETIRQQRLNANLIILAACQTGVGEITGDGVQGVARMFMIAGAKNAMVSLWSVPQSQTLELMYAFHEERKQKKQNIALSLRQAQLELLEMYRNQVALWAGFILIGEGK